MLPRFSSLFSVSLMALCWAGPTLGAPGDVPAKATPTPAAPKESGVQEIQVTLFGQPCTMSGPYPRPALSLLHEISPEKIPPDLSVDQMKRVRTKCGELKGMPMPIEQYRDHLRRRLSAKIAFEEAIAQSKKSKAKDGRALDPFLTNVKEHISTLQYTAFSGETRKAFESGGAIWNEPFLTSLRERFENVIQPDTEEEFHKAIRAVKIQYVCAFDDNDHRDDETE